MHESEAEFIEMVRAKSAVRQEETAAAHKRQIASSQKRIAELDMLIRRSYEDNVAGKLSDKRFGALSHEYETEQSELESLVLRLQVELDSFNPIAIRWTDL